MNVLLAVYRPAPAMLDFVTALQEAAPGTGFVVVDDGSGAAHHDVLDRAAALGCTVLRHDTNRGKGAALKTGLRHLGSTADVVCADPDGQHHIADLLRVADRLRETGHLVLGVRHFEGDVPLRSRIGNGLTRRLFRVATGRAVRDTQTGLRGYPAAMIDRLTRVPGERFEYEMNVLLDAARAGLPIEEVSIKTSYFDDNESSHFGSVSDSVRIYRPLLRLAVSSLRVR